MKHHLDRGRWRGRSRRSRGRNRPFSRKHSLWRQAASIFRIEFDGLGEIFDCAVPRARIQARKTSNRPVGGEIVDVVDEAARGEQRDDLRRRLPGGLFV